MSGRYALLLVFFALGASACASGERVARLETAVAELQTHDIRIALLEDKVTALEQGAVPAQEASAAPPLAAKSKANPAPAAPRRVEQKTAPAKQASPAKVSPARIEREYQAALSAYEAGRFQAAMPMFSSFMQAYPNHALAANAGYWLGECRYALKRYSDAADSFKDVVAQHPGHPKAAAAMLKAGYCYALLGDSASARTYFEALLRDYPTSPPAALARPRLAAL